MSVAESYGDFVGKVDGVIITARHGDNHYKYAKPYIGSGIPMFIDKPITVGENEAVAFMKELKENGVRISGGSSCVHAAGVKQVRAAIASGEKGEILGGFVRAPLSMENAYGGFFFYVQHAVEVACSLFGYYPRSVRAYQNGKKYTFLWRYDSYDITVQAVDGNYRYAAAASLDGGFVGGDFTLDGCFEAEFSAYYETLTGDRCADYNDFIAPVFIMNAMYRALQSGKEEPVLRAERI